MTKNQKKIMNENDMTDDESTGNEFEILIEVPSSEPQEGVPWGEDFGRPVQMPPEADMSVEDGPPVC